MNYNRAVLFGSLAGLLGAAAWAAIAYYANYEIGWLAWGIGLAVGAATVKGAGFGSQFVGVTAAVITVIAIVLGKYATAELTMVDIDFDPQQIVEESLANLNDEVLAYVADEMAAAREAAGERIAWPDQNVELVSGRDAYPADLWSAATEKYQKFSEQEKLAHRTKVEELIRNDIVNLEAMEDQIRQQSFLQTFSLFDLLFFGLAISTAYSVGRSNEFDSDAKETGENDYNRNASTGVPTASS
jgi:hypothetical protein